MSDLPPRVLLVSGSQEFFAERAIAGAASAWRAAGFEIHEVSGKSTEVAADVVMSASPDLFGAAPVILLRQAEALDDPGAAQVCDTIAANPDTAWIIWHGGGRGSPKAKARLVKAALHTVAAEPLKGRAVADFVIAEFRAQGRSADQSTVALLIDAVGADPRGLASAVNQLCSDLEERHISRDAAARYYSGHVGVKGYEIADAVADRRPADAVESLRFALLEGGTSAGLMTVSALSTMLRRVAAAKSARSGPSAAADVAAALKIPEWMARPAVAQARKWTPDEIASAIATLADLSVLMKGGYESTGSLSEEQKRYVLETAVIAMATPAAQRG
ncbi:MAG: DNA polymerase III subunit delta [Candidatus Nanopelagicales bacterium]